MDGERRWFTKIDPAPAVSKLPGNEGSVSAIPGAVFAGGWDGVLRVLATDGGRVLWEYNMVQEYKTVNGVAAKGGSMVAAGPTVAGAGWCSRGPAIQGSEPAPVCPGTCCWRSEWSNLQSLSTARCFVQARRCPARFAPEPLRSDPRLRPAIRSDTAN